MDKPIHYQIKVKGHLDDLWAASFDGLTIANLETGETVLAGHIQDQAALQSVLNRVSNLGLTLISVNPVSNDETRIKEKKMNTNISHSDLIRRLVLRIHGTFLLILTPIMTTIAMVGWALGKGPFALWHDIQFATPGLFQAYLLMFIVGVVLWIGSYQESGLRKWNVIGLLAHLPPLAVDFIFIKLFLAYHFQGDAIFSVTLHTVWILIESFAILYTGQGQQVPSAG